MDVPDLVECDSPSPVVFNTPTVDSVHPPVTPPEDVSALERTVNYVLDDCFFTVGQVVGTRKALEYETVIWWRDHYRMKFSRAIRAFGDRWLEDRRNVTGVAFLLAERAVRHAGDAASIGVESARNAAVDVERYCQLHSRRRLHGRRADHGALADETAVPLVAGYWCITPAP